MLQLLGTYFEYALESYLSPYWPELIFAAGCFIVARWLNKRGKRP